MTTDQKLFSYLFNQNYKKLDSILQNKVIQKSKLSLNVNNTLWADSVNKKSNLKKIELLAFESGITHFVLKVTE